MARWNDIDLAALRRVVARYGAAAVRQQLEVMAGSRHAKRGPEARPPEFQHLVWALVERRAIELKLAGIKRRAVSEACRQIAGELRTKFPTWQLGPDRIRKIHSDEQRHLRTLWRQYLVRGMRVKIAPAKSDQDAGARAAILAKPRRRIERS